MRRRRRSAGTKVTVGEAIEESIGVFRQEPPLQLGSLKSAECILTPYAKYYNQIIVNLSNKESLIKRIVVNVVESMLAKPLVSENVLVQERENLIQLIERKQHLMNMQKGIFATTATTVSAEVVDVYNHAKKRGSISMGELGEMQAEFKKVTYMIRMSRERLRRGEDKNRGMSLEDYIIIFSDNIKNRWLYNNIVNLPPEEVYCYVHNLNYPTEKVRENLFAVLMGIVVNYYVNNNSRKTKVFFENLNKAGMLPVEGVTTKCTI